MGKLFGLKCLVTIKQKRMQPDVFIHKTLHNIILNDVQCVSKLTFSFCSCIYYIKLYLGISIKVVF